MFYYMAQDRRDGLWVVHPVEAGSLKEAVELTGLNVAFVFKNVHTAKFYANRFNRI